MVPVHHHKIASMKNSFTCGGTVLMGLFFNYFDFFFGYSNWDVNEASKEIMKKYE